MPGTLAEGDSSGLLPTRPVRSFPEATLRSLDHGAIEKADVVVTPDAWWVAVQLASDCQRPTVCDPPAPPELRPAASTVHGDYALPRAAFAADRVPYTIVQASPRADGHSSRGAPEQADDATANHVDLEHAARRPRLALLDDVLVTVRCAQPDDDGEAACSRVEARTGDPHES